jgi:hypothetical protein
MPAPFKNHMWSDARKGAACGRRRLATRALTFAKEGVRPQCTHCQDIFDTLALHGDPDALLGTR